MSNENNITEESSVDEKQPDKLEITETSTETPPYTIFQTKERVLLVIVLALSGFWGTASSPIYFPALPAIGKYFNTDESTTNLSVLTYLIFQGVFPTISSNLADKFGRRPVILTCLVVYIAACIGISQANSIYLLIGLRCIQAAGIAPVFSISSGIAGDVCTTATLGGMVAMIGGLQLMGNGIGGLLGAALISGFNTWRAIFVFLAIGGGGTLILAVFMLPETSRRIAGNGSVVPKHYANYAPILLVPSLKARLTNDVETLTTKASFDILGPFKIFFKPVVFFTLLPSGIFFAAWTMVLTSLSTELESPKYNFTTMQVGLVYLPQGITCAVGSLVVGRVLNRYYRYRKNNYDMKYKDVIHTQVPPFNIVKSRVYPCILPAILMVCGLVIFGWCIQYSKSLASIIISTCMISVSSSITISISATLVVDLFPGKGSASASCVNLMRCLLAAAGTGVLEKMISAMNLGGTYTLIAGLSLLSSLGFVYVVYLSNKMIATHVES
ncbi:uncharacterized protein J8A68_000613 [[Candida] subhashii]|uniref:Major facilitator superfamily (MFS) profile domain-containing protein n=1 Tax=[Candida] subhashii TaxID=561895 RepID=A0A8J5QQM5_9ASCO|nr:uncharacterized protein J8A68_000613 [[Candida] subhashii]KAG7665788.1 hypothetical protein J8A68_000613 [[Candida] subhashii]